VINISELAVIGALEAYLILTLGLVVFIVLNHKLRMRIKTLTSWLDQLKAKTAELLADTASGESLSYKDYLGRESDLTRDRFESQYPDKTLGIDSTNSPEENLMALRHLFLQAEADAFAIDDDVKKWQQIGLSLDAVISSFGAVTPPFEKEVSTSDLSTKWQELCEAAVYTFESNNNEARDAFINLLQIINNELGFDEIFIPEFTNDDAPADVLPMAADSEEPDETSEALPEEVPEDPEFAETVQLSEPVMLSDGESPSSPEAIERHNHRIDVEKLKEMTARQQALIDTLQQENQDANSVISLKASELDQLTAFFDEATECIERLEGELDAAVARTVELEEDLQDVPEMKALIQRFSEESSNMLTCIETLEKENEQLRDRSTEQRKAG